jgi:hypothetical protein
MSSETSAPIPTEYGKGGQLATGDAAFDPRMVRETLRDVWNGQTRPFNGDCSAMRQ